MKHFILFSLTLILNFGVGTAQKLEYAKPEDVGMSSQRLKHIDYYFNEAISNKEIPGAVTFVARNGKVVYHKAFGNANSKGRKMERDDIFRIASMTKAITATAVMILWEEGVFKLEDPISNWIPEFKNPQILDSLYEDGSYTTIPARREITIRDLLTHSSGVGYGEIDSDPRFKKLFNNADITELFTKEKVLIQEEVKKIGSLPIHHDPGEKYTYSTGLDILAAFIEIVTEKPLNKFFQERIFTPLNMTDTYFYLPKEKEGRLVEVQTKKNNTFVRYEAEFYDVDYPIEGAKTFFSGGAGLSSTALDYAKFIQMYLNNGVYDGKRVLSRKTIELIMSNQFDKLWPNSGKHLGLAFDVINKLGTPWNGAKSVGTFSWGGYFNTSYIGDPEEQMIGIILKQTWDIGWDESTTIFHQLLYQAVDD